MTRLLLLPLAALLASGCAFNDCGADSFAAVNGFRTAEAAIAPADTLTVLFDADDGLSFVEVFVSLEALTPTETEGERAAVAANVEYGGYDAREVPLFEGEARADTLVVPLDRRVVGALAARAPCADGASGVVRPVCSPPEPFYRLYVTNARAPAGTRAVRYVLRDGRGSLRPLRPGAPPEASALRARTARG